MQTLGKGHGMTDENAKLVGAFEAVSYDEWRKRVEEDLKGAPFEKRLVTRTHEGLDLQPIYRCEDWPSDGDPGGFPGEMPYTRGARASGRPGGWEIRQDYAMADPAACNRAMRTDLRGPVDAPWIRLDCAGRRGLDADDKRAHGSAGMEGVSLSSAEDLEVLLEGIDPQETPLSFQAGAGTLALAALMLVRARKSDVSSQTLVGSLAFDPLAELAETGSLPGSLERAYEQIAVWSRWCAEHAPNLRSLCVDTGIYHDAGVNAVEELAIALAAGAEGLRVLTERGMELKAALLRMEFIFSVGRNFFMEIAKLRAARLLWSKLVLASGGDESSPSMRLYARTSGRTLTRDDPYVNILRKTAESFAAAAGGADGVATQAFDAALGEPEDFGRRIAANTQAILKEETHLDRVMDPAGGSSYVERLTEDLARKAWEFFQEIEKQGGMATALRSGWLLERIVRTAEKRRKAVAKRKDSITGVSEFPNPAEILPVRGNSATDAWRRATDERLRNVRAKPGRPVAFSFNLDPADSETYVESLLSAAERGATLGELSAALWTNGAEESAPVFVPKREAEDFERLRERAREFEKRTGRPPRVFLANMGSIPKHKARATFAANFYGAGGFLAVENDGFLTPEDCAAAFADSEADLAVICSTDETYPETVPVLAPLLKKAGAKSVALAGRPGEHEQNFMDAGVDTFLFLGCDALEILESLQQKSGVSP